MADTGAGSKRAFSTIDSHGDLPENMVADPGSLAYPDVARSTDAIGVSEDADDTAKTSEAAATANADLENPAREDEGEDLRAAVMASFSADKAGPDLVHVDSLWLDEFVAGKDAPQPVIKAKGAAGRRISPHLLSRIASEYGLDENILSFRVAFARSDRPATLLRLNASISLRDALVEAGALKPGDLEGETLRIFGAVLYSQFVRDSDLNNASKALSGSVVVADTELDDLETVVIDDLRRWPIGLTGLSNMGNTCFMNSSLQALLHIPELVAYFLDGSFKNDLNHDNPIGCGGEVAEAFAALVRLVYAERGSSVRPFQFRTAIGKFNRAFASRMQQDSQEFTVFLLDSLHEDLNRVIQKPPTTKPELSDGEPVTPESIRALASKSWETHGLRNSSKIMELFTGMYKSTLICPVCSKVSVTFDPFFDLTLPLPSARFWVKDVEYVPADPEQPLYKVSVACSPIDSVLHMKQQVAGLFGSEATRLIASDVFQHKFYRILRNEDTLADTIESSDVVVIYELPDPALGTSAPVYLRSGGHAGTGMPFYISVPRGLPGDDLQLHIVRALRERLGQNSSFAVRVFEGNIDELSYGYGDSRSWPLEEVVARRDQELTSTTNIGNHFSPEERSLESFENVVAASASEESTERLPTPDRSPRQHHQPAPGGSPAETPVSDSSPISPLSDSPSPMDSTGELQSITLAPRELNLDNTVFIVDVEAEFPIPTPEVVHNPAAQSAAEDLEAHKNTTLEDCLERFAHPEVLGEQDLWYCPRCKDFRQAQKQLELWRVPEVLMIHLKRFSGFQNVSKKISDLVTFPLEGLDLGVRLGDGADTNPGDYVYDLVAVDNHFGGMGGGHYTAYVKDPFGPDWLNFNDSYVTQVSPENVVTEAAYLLFYKRRTASGKDHVAEAQRAVMNLRRNELSNSGNNDSSASGQTSRKFDGAPVTGSDLVPVGRDSIASASSLSASPVKSPSSNSSDSVFTGEGQRLGGLDASTAPRLPWDD